MSVCSSALRVGVARDLVRVSSCALQVSSLSNNVAAVTAACCAIRVWEMYSNICRC